MLTLNKIDLALIYLKIKVLDRLYYITYTSIQFQTGCVMNSSLSLIRF